MARRTEFVTDAAHWLDTWTIWKSANKGWVNLPEAARPLAAASTAPSRH